MNSMPKNILEIILQNCETILLAFNLIPLLTYYGNINHLVNFYSTIVNYSIVVMK